MSDQTPETLGGSIAVEPAEPSMEDILASIRRIIADDETTDASAASNGPVMDSLDIGDLAAVPAETIDQNDIIAAADLSTDQDILVLDEILDLSDDDFSVDDLEIPTISLPVEDDDDILIDIGEALGTEADVSAVQSNTDSLDAIAATASLASSDDLISTSDFPDDIDIILDDRIDLVADGESGLGLNADSDIMDIVDSSIADIEETAIDTRSFSAADVETSQFEAAELEAGDDDVIDLVGDLLAKTDAYDVPAVDVSAVEAANLVTAHKTVTEPNGFEDISGDEDMDLVKSLMADLTDDRFNGDMGAVNSDVNAAPLDIDEVLASDTAPGADEIDLVDHILDMSIEDEIALGESAVEDSEPLIEIDDVSDNEIDTDILQAEDVSDDEISSEQDVDAAEDDEEIDPIDASINSLLQIAASADRDAETPLEIEVDNTDADADVAASLDVFDDEPLLETEDVDIALTPEPLDETDDLAALMDGDFTEEDSSDSDIIDDSDIDELEPASILETDPLLTASGAGLAALAVGYVMPTAEKNADPSGLDDVTEKLEAEQDDETVILPEDEIITPEDIVSDDIATSDDIIIPPLDVEQETTEMPKLVAKDGIVDEVTEAATVEAFDSLNQIVDEKTEYQQSGPRIGDLVQDALKPMLKEWLDENLKSIVERAVTKEVKRISSGK